MSRQKERRKFPRRDCLMRCLCEGEGFRFNGHIVNLSYGGAGITGTEKLPSLGIELLVTMGHIWKNLQLRSKVVWVKSIEGSQEHRLTHEEEGWVGRPAWTPNSREILFPWSAHTLERRAFRLELEGGELQSISGLGEDVGSLSVSGNRLVCVQFRSASEAIWRVRGRAASSSDRVPEELIGSSVVDGAPSFSPYGKKSHSRRREVGLKLSGSVTVTAPTLYKGQTQEEIPIGYLTVNTSCTMRDRRETVMSIGSTLRAAPLVD